MGIAMMADSLANETQESCAESEGTLNETSVPGLLANAWRDRRSGWLTLTSGNSERRIQLQDGSPVAIETGLDQDQFASALQVSELVTPQQRIEIERLARERQIPQTSAVLALRLLDGNALYKAIRDSARTQICETFEWQSGNFEWTPPDADPPNTKPHDILSLIQTQLPDRWGNDRLFASLIPDSDRYCDIPPRFRRVAEKLSLASKGAQQAVARLDGSIPLGQILGESAGDPLAASTLWTLLHAGVMRVLSERRCLDAAPVKMEFEVEVTAAATVAEPTAGSKSSAPDSAANSKIATKARKLRTEIETLLELLPDLDHYAVLDLSPSSGPAEFKRAYFKAAKKFHPDALARMGLQDLRDDAAQVFARIAAAFEVLSDPDKKTAYDAGSDEPEIDTARLAQAETSFRKGEILLKMGNFNSALEYLEPAVNLWPEEPAYQAALGWALHKQSQPDASRAREHLEIASTQAPDDATILYRLGVVIRAAGEMQTGDEMIARARALAPSLEE